MSGIRVYAVATALDEDKVVPTNEFGVLHNGCLRLPYFSKVSPSEVSKFMFS